MAQATFSDLPVEVLYRIFHYCDAQTILCKVRFVCKKLLNVVNQYNQIKLEYKLDKQMNFNRCFRFVPTHAVSSLILSFTYDDIPESLMRTCMWYIRRFTQVRYLSFDCVNNRDLQLFSECSNYTRLASLTIRTIYMSNPHTWPITLSIMQKNNPQRLRYKEFSSKHEDFSWPSPCQLTHLTLYSCCYSQ